MPATPRHLRQHLEHGALHISHHPPRIATAHTVTSYALSSAVVASASAAAVRLLCAALVLRDIMLHQPRRSLSCASCMYAVQGVHSSQRLTAMMIELRWVGWEGGKEVVVERQERRWRGAGQEDAPAPLASALRCSRGGPLRCRVLPACCAAHDIFGCTPLQGLRLRSAHRPPASASFCAWAEQIVYFCPLPSPESRFIAHCRGRR
jgi:hypothetical protein